MEPSPSDPTTTSLLSSFTTPSALPSDFAATFKTGEALKLALPTLYTIAIKRRHEQSGHSHHGRKRNAIADDLLHQAESQRSSANSLRIGYILFLSLACMVAIL